MVANLPPFRNCASRLRSSLLDISRFQNKRYSKRYSQIPAMRASHLFKPSLHCVYGSLALAACTLALSIHEPMAAAVVQSTQANETGTDPGPVPVARKVDGTGTIIPPTYASTSTLVQVVTAPTQTITEFFDGLGSSGSSLSTQVSTAGTAPTPTGQ